MAKKIGSEIKIENSDFKAKVGTLDKKSHRVIYIEAGAFLKPTVAKASYKEDINNFKKNTENKIWAMLKESDTFSNDYIFKLDVSENRTNIKKPTFLSMQLFLKFKNDTSNESFSSITNKLSDVFNNILSMSAMTIKNEGFTLSRSK